jgi:hypothetical protein
MKQPEEHIKELARRLCAAAVSCEMGISLQHAYKSWVKNQESEIGGYWISLAEQVFSRHAAPSTADSDKGIGDKVAATAEELFARFEEHVRELQSKQPEMIDRSIIFEGWIVQRVAGLQALAVHLSEQIAALNRKQ